MLKKKKDETVDFKKLFKVSVVLFPHYERNTCS